MRVTDYYSPGRTPISFEIYPPKTPGAQAQLEAALPRLAKLRPDFMTVTYGALGSTRGQSLALAAGIQREYGLTSASHLTCVGASRSELDELLRAVRGAGVENLMALRGDPPKGLNRFVPPPGGFAHADELVAHIRDFEFREGLTPCGLGVAGYPEKHPEAPDFAADLANLKRKVEAGADFVVTQLFYDNRSYFRFVEAARKAGIRAPIVPGLLPVVSGIQARRIAAACGAVLPAELDAELAAAGADEARGMEIGARQAVGQARELLARGAPGLHFFVMNRADHIASILKALRSDRLDEGPTSRNAPLRPAFLRESLSAQPVP
jgi:methylenetetrahydrofolate reductase (NADPH)